MNDDAIAFHSSEPGHLSFGKLVNGVRKKGKELIIAQDSEYVLGYELVLQAVIDKILGADTAVQEALHLLDQALLETGVKTGVYAGIAGFPIH